MSPRKAHCQALKYLLNEYVDGRGKTSLGSTVGRYCHAETTAPGPELSMVYSLVGRKSLPGGRRAAVTPSPSPSAGCWPAVSLPLWALPTPRPGSGPNFCGCPGTVGSCTRCLLCRGAGPTPPPVWVTRGGCCQTANTGDLDSTSLLKDGRATIWASMGARAGGTGFSLQ